MTDQEQNRFSARAARYARVGANVGGVAARMAGTRLFGGDGDAANAAALAKALGGLKGPLMKVAQLLSTIPDAVPAEYAEELAKLQNEAPPMGAAFVRRRMAAELGLDWQNRFGSFDFKPAAAASLGQVHRAVSRDGLALACKLQYPDMASAVEADLSQLDVLFAIQRRMSPAIDARDAITEIGARLREELDYEREARHGALYALMLADEDQVRVPKVQAELSTERLLTMEWLDGAKLLTFKDAPLETRNRIAVAMFKAWWHPFSHYGVIHGDPHLGNYTVRTEDEAGTPTVAGINLLDYGCVRIFPAGLRGRCRRSLRGAAGGRPGAHRSRLRDLGLQGPEPPVDRHLEHLGTLHLRADPRRSGTNGGGRRRSRSIRPQGSLPGASGAEAAWRHQGAP